MNPLHQQILDAIKDRSEWETRQQTWYELRHQGLRRRNKPYPGAPDMHFPLIDASIDKHKPFYVQQIYATDTLAAFVSKKPETSDTQEIAAWFDYKVKQESNFEREAICGIDTLLQNGGAPIKVYWKSSKKRLEFDACDPLHVIVPKWTEELQDADWLVHVLHMSEAQYRRNPNYRKDDEFVKEIKGKGSDQTGDDSGKLQEIARREGLTCGQNDEQIVLWEIYTRDPTNSNKIIIKTRSPLKFEEQVRADFQMPYTEGVFKDGWFPFVKWRGEIKDKGYYSARGLAEILSPFETALCKMWNGRLEWMDFHSKPLYEELEWSTGNTGNVNTYPGAIVPRGLKAVTPPTIPNAFAEEMNGTRESAEYRVQSPDFGIMQRKGHDPTATEINAVAGQQGQGVDLKARIFRLDLGDTYRMAWSLLLQYGKESLQYVLDGEGKGLPQEALEDCYEVMPNGSADSWNKGMQLAKADARFKKFALNPYIKQGPLVKSVLAADEPRLVKELYQEPQDMQAGEMEEQAQEISVMLLGFPAAIDPTDDDKAHLLCLAQYVDQTLKNQEVIEPRFARLALKHGAEHTDALMQKKDPAAKQINQQLLPIIQILSQIAQQPDPREIAAQQAQNVVQMTGGVGPQPPTAIEGSPPASVPQEVIQ